jgi:hypothetical protein
MTTLNPKAPSAILAYDIDFGGQLGDDWIESIVATVGAGTVVIEKETITDNVVRLLISGGADLEDAELSITVTSRGGQVFAQPFTLAVRAGVQAKVATTTTKRVVVEMAFEVMNLANYEFDATPEELFATLRTLDVMMAEWQGPGRNILIGYNSPVIAGQGDLDDPIGVPDWTLDGIATSLALRRAPTIGKTFSAEANRAHRRSMDSINAAFSKTVERPIPRSTPGFWRGRRAWFGPVA